MSGATGLGPEGLPAILHLRADDRHDQRHLLERRARALTTRVFCRVYRFLAREASYWMMSSDAFAEPSVASGGASRDEDFDQFFRMQLRPLIALAYALAGSRQVAEDLAQEALLAAFKHWDRVRELESPGGWLRRVVANRAVSNVRRRIVEVATMSTRLRLHDEEGSTIGTIPADTEHVWAAIRKLPRRQAQVITLRTLDRSTVAEIADVLEISEEAASTHLRRARQTLTRQLTRGDIQ
jgi:RNA polymerase sigma factor (sigma-70 family)